jgi:hypothetical protein
MGAHLYRFPEGVVARFMKHKRVLAATRPFIAECSQALIGYINQKGRILQCMYATVSHVHMVVNLRAKWH